MKSILLTPLVLILFCGVAAAQTDGFELLFNGKDLTGWGYLPTTEAQKKAYLGWKKNDPTAPPWPFVEEEVSFGGKAQSEDGRFVADDGALVVSVPPEGRKIQNLYCGEVIEGDFELRLEFRASENADSGVFIRGKQLQCRDYPNAGPYKDLKKFKPGDWNELVVVVKGDSAQCTCNGELLEESFKVPAKGPIGVEGDRGKFEYRNIRIKRATSNLLKPTNEMSLWQFEQHKDGKGKMSVDGDSIVFETTQPGDQNWHVQAFQVGLDLKEGAEYVVSFEAKSNVNASIVLQGSINKPDWHGIGFHREVELSTEFENYEYRFRPTDVVEGVNRVGFSFGTQEATVSIRNLMLRATD